MQPMADRSDPVDRLLAAWRAELPDVLAATSELTKRILVLSAELDAAARRELPELGLTMAEFDVLATLRRAGRPYTMKPNELSRALLLSTGGTSNVINRLVAGGLVVREADPDDGRSTLTRLTAEGVEAAEAAVRAISAAHAEVFATVPDAVVAAVTTALRDLSAAVRSPRARPAAASGISP